MGRPALGLLDFDTGSGRKAKKKSSPTNPGHSVFTRRGCSGCARAVSRQSSPLDDRRFADSGIPVKLCGSLERARHFECGVATKRTSVPEG